MGAQRVPSAREAELLEAAYRYALTHGLSDLSLRPLAAAIGSSPRVLLYLFGSKDGLVRALLARARADELDLLERLRRQNTGAGLPQALEVIWAWLADPARRELLALWLDGYAQAVADPAGPWAGFAEQTVTDWLAVLEQFQAPAERRSPEGAARRALALAVLRGALLDLLATGDPVRADAIIRQQVQLLDAG